MGGEWALGVALVMEVWEGRSRAVLAGLVGTSANLGFALVAWLSLGLDTIRQTLAGWGLTGEWLEWRLLMLCGVLPAFLTFGIRLIVPESRAWAAGRKGGELQAWAPRDLFGVAIGVVAGCGLLVLWSTDFGWPVRVAGSVVALLVIGIGFLSPARRYLQRTSTSALSRRLLGRMLLGAALAGVPLIGTWAAVQWAPVWGDQLVGGAGSVKSYTQIASALGAVLGTFLGAVLAAWIGRRWSYVALCLASLGSVILFYQTNDGFSAWFLWTVAVMGGVSAAFYGWLPVYLRSVTTLAESLRRSAHCRPARSWGCSPAAIRKPVRPWPRSTSSDWS
jgi:MFS family permease